jgi:hypothetical protein
MRRTIPLLTAPLLFVLALFVLGPAASTPALADDDKLPQFPKIAPPDSLPDAACDAAQANSKGWIVGTWVSAAAQITIAADRWQASGARDASGTIVTVDQCAIHLGNTDANLPSFDAIRTETGALYGTLRQGEDKPRFALFHKKN